MKNLIQGIINIYFENSKNLGYKLYDIEKNLLLSIKDGSATNSDFFYFLFEENLLEDYKFDSIFHNLSQFSIDEKKLSEFDAFDKNLNIIVLLKVENDLDISDDLKKRAYEIEEDPYFFRKKVIFYTQNQFANFTENNLNISSFSKIEEDIKDNNKRFILNLLVGLSFIKINFSGKITDEKNIFFEAFDDTYKKEISSTKLGYQIQNRYELFNDQIKKINSTIYNQTIISGNTLTELEIDILGLFGESQTELEETLLSKKSIKNENY
ncbi:hypothetical protein HOO68_04690 [Candidatus Gracilibacteria bacterium]|nr:hypothetical protein [Candidatus Gracilibacteria bacterium]